MGVRGGVPRAERRAGGLAAIPLVALPAGAGAGVRVMAPGWAGVAGKLASISPAGPHRVRVRACW